MPHGARQDHRRPRRHRCNPYANEVARAARDTLERLDGEINRRTKVVGIFPNEAAITRLVRAILLEPNEE